MGKTKIEWTDYTFNPWVGCHKISEGCANCYAERQMTRNTTWSNTWGPEVLTQRIPTADSNWRKPVRWNTQAKAQGKPLFVFSGSLCDIFEEHRDVTDSRSRLIELIDSTPHLIWLLLTKRPENVNDMVPPHWRMVPPENLWIGTSVENQKNAVNRLRHFRHINAVVKFVSYEPAIGPVSWSGWEPYLQWMIFGGESGARSRDANSRWAIMAKNWCERNGIPFFMKQMGTAWAVEMQMSKQYPKGENFDAFPKELQVREVPEVVYQPKGSVAGLS